MARPERAARRCGGREHLARRGAAPLLALFLAALPLAAPAMPARMALHYDVYAAGFHVLALDLHIDEANAAYDVVGYARATGILGWISDFTSRSESRGTIAADRFSPRMHESASHWRRGERAAHIDYGSDGAVMTALSPLDEPGLPPAPTAQQIRGTVDPLTALLAISHRVARDGHCGVSVPVYDGRRRYDLVLADQGVEPAPSSAAAASGEVRRCSVAIIKVAGFFGDRGEAPHAEHGQAWIAPARNGLPPLPLRVEFHSNWGLITVQMEPGDPAG